MSQFMDWCLLQGNENFKSLSLKQIYLLKQYVTTTATFRHTFLSFYKYSSKIKEAKTLKAHVIYNGSP
jgi:hypothetical protein